VNGGLAHYESIKRVCVVADEWSVEDGTMTPSMKLKRRVVNERYAKEISAFYADEATSKG
jgi:long-chain acyl-CoA synthetase